MGGLCKSITMPKYYCEYCDAPLTHDSPAGRKQHNTGFKHKSNVRAYYANFIKVRDEELTTLNNAYHTPFDYSMYQLPSPGIIFPHGWLNEIPTKEKNLTDRPFLSI